MSLDCEQESEDEDMSAGREHAERRAAQAAAARKHRNKAKYHRPDKSWKRDDK